MNTYSLLSLCIMVPIIVAVCESSTKGEITDEFVLRWEVGSNFLEGNRFRSDLVIINQSDRILYDDWNLYFNFLRMADVESISPQVRLTHINGNLYKLSPSDRYAPLPPGEQLPFSFEAFGSAIKEIDAPDGAYFEFTDGDIITVKVITGQFERDEQVHRRPDDIFPIPTAEFVYKRNASLSQLPVEEIGKIVPSPVSIIANSGSFTLTGETSVFYQKGLENEARFLSESLVPLLKAKLPVAVLPTTNERAIFLRLAEGEGEQTPSGAEGYTLKVTEEHIEITGVDKAGVFYGIQSLRSLFPVDAWISPSDSTRVDAVIVEDAPGFRYRGLHLDVSRNFQSVETVKKLLDVMAFYKLNKFHFHLTDDEGWRLEIQAFPELAEIGGRRGHTHDERTFLIPSYGSGPDPDPEVSIGSGWYTREEYIDILRYARERHIEVIPEIDVPGHARAAIVAMKARYERLMAENKIDEADAYRIHDPEDTSEYRSIQRWDDNVINVCQESTYRFFEVVFDEIIDMYREAQVPLTTIHIGGDEVPKGVWVDSPKCQALLEKSPDLHSIDQLQVWFFGRMKQILEERNIVMSGWEEIALIGYYGGEKELNPAFAGAAIPYVWSNIWGAGTEEYTYKLANAGYSVVLSHASNFYFDFAYNKHPKEAGFYWGGFVDTPDPFGFIPFDLYKSGIMDQMGRSIPDHAYENSEKLSSEGRNNILGLQGQLWGETFRSPDRVEYMVLPRLISLAERSWSPQQDWMEITDRRERLEELAGVWNEFANRLGRRELPRLDVLNGGYGYRIPPPGAVIEDGTLKANVAYPGLSIRFTLDGSEPTIESILYDGPVDVHGNREVKLRTFNTHGQGSRIVELGVGKE
jgi:hexosaminidase